MYPLSLQYSFNMAVLVAEAQYLVRKVGSIPLQSHMARWWRWSTRRPVTAKITGSSPVRVAKGRFPIPRSGKVGRGRGDEKFAFLGNSFLVINCCRYLNVCLDLAYAVYKDSCPTLFMGSGSAWGGRLPCKQDIRWVRFPQDPPYMLVQLSQVERPYWSGRRRRFKSVHRFIIIDGLFLLYNFLPTNEKIIRYVVLHRPNLKKRMQSFLGRRGGKLVTDKHQVRFRYIQPQI